MAEDNCVGPTRTGTVMADVGGDRGALVLYTPASMVGAEIEISPVNGGMKTHVAVRERLVSENRLYAAFYPSLPAGIYVVWGLDSRPAGKVTIVGEEVAELSIGGPAGGDGAAGFTISPRT